MKKPKKNDISALAEWYDGLVDKYGDGPEGAQWTDLETQERRYEFLLQIGDLSNSHVLDFGCGTGGLYSFLHDKKGFSGQYTGFDISAKAIALAKEKYPGVDFRQVDIFEQDIDEKFDFILASGVFNNQMADNFSFMTSVISKIFPLANKGIAFNALTTCVDYQDEGLYYASAPQVLEYCLEHVSPCVTLRHDYQVKDGVRPFEFALYAYRCGFSPVSTRDDQTL